MGLHAGVTEAEIANYLLNTPGFFERHAELLARVQLASPHGTRAVSLQERQAQVLRDRLRGLEQRVLEMIRHGQENVASAERLHRYVRALLLERDPARRATLAVDALRHEFLVPHVAIRLWGGGQGGDMPVGDDTKAFAASLAHPYCGANSGFEAASWLGEPAAVQSIALLPLRLAPAGAVGVDAAGHDPGVPDGVDAGMAAVASGRAAASATFGLLALGSPDPTRYAAGMGTEFLSRLAELTAAALAPAPGVQPATAATSMAATAAVSEGAAGVPTGVLAPDAGIPAPGPGTPS